MSCDVKSCKSCTHWDLEYAGNKPIEVGRLSHGQCLKALHLVDDGKVNLSSPMLTIDGSQYMAILMTLPTHCCKEWADVA